MQNVIDVGLLLLVGFILVQTIFVFQRHYLQLLCRAANRKVMILSASLFVPIHEISHLVIAVLCGHKIGKVSMFQDNGSGTLGFVEHSYKPSAISPFTNMLIGMAPIAGGLIAVIGLFSLTGVSIPSYSADDYFHFEGHTSVNFFSVIENFLATNVNNMHDGVFLLVMILAVNIMVFAVPSKEDFTGAKKGLLITLGLIFISAYLSNDSGVTFGVLSVLSMSILPMFLATVIVMFPINLVLYFVTKMRGR